MNQKPHAGPPRRPGVVRRTHLLLDAETRELLDEHWKRRGGTLHAAATEVFHAGFRVLAEQTAALDSFDDAPEPPPAAAGLDRNAPYLSALSGKGYGPLSGAR
jgi:hypothetical protein